jgi:hypothetical protein
LHRQLRIENFQLHSSSNGIPIRGGSITFQSQAKKMIFIFQVVPQEACPRRIAVRHPDVQIAIQVPVHGSHTTTIVWEVESARGRDVGKTTIPHVQKTAVLLPSAE